MFRKLQLGNWTRLALTLSALGLALFPALPAAAQTCQFIFGFAALHAQIPGIVGECVTNETHNQTTGDGQQQTTNGLLLWRKADNWTAFTDGYRTWVVTTSGVQSRLETQRFSWEPNPAGLPIAAGVGESNADTYLDDRSNEVALLLSLVNAINRDEFVRAYSYWEPGAEGLPAYADFAAGYANTGAVQIYIGTVRTGAAAGNLYSRVPVVLVAQNNNGTTQTFAGCYTLHLGQPANQAVPPFRGWGIQAGKLNPVANNADRGPLLANACPADGGPLAPQGQFNPADLSAARYLDDRSTPQQLLRSLVNALNRREYVRAYSYWEPNAPELDPYADFEAGYADTASVSIAFGKVTGDAGAGQRYYSVPVTLIAKSTGGQTRTYVGCYVLHQSVPSIQGVPPFQPLGIRSAEVQAVANNANTAQLMSTICN